VGDNGGWEWIVVLDW